MQLNKPAYEKAKHLIKAHHYVKDSDWSEAQPDPDRENEIIEDKGWDEFSQWYLGVYESESKETKQRYGFPYGDFQRLHYSGLIAIKQRAAQNDYPDIVEAADELLELYDQEAA